MIRWIKTWLFSDRIRFAPGHSRLFQLKVGDRVLVRDRLWSISQRVDCVSGSCVHVQFDMIEEDAACLAPVSLWLDLGDDTSIGPSVHWDGPGQDDELFVEDVTILKS